MTSLDKPVRRRTCRPWNHQHRRLVVMLEPGDIIALREERRRRWYRLSLADVYQAAVRRAVALERNARRKGTRR